MEWLDRFGGHIQRKINGGTVWLLPPETEHSVKWLRESLLIVLHVDPVWAARVAPGVVEHGHMEQLQVCVALDPIIAALSAEMYRICEGSALSVDMQVIALGHCLAARVLQMLSQRSQTASISNRRQLKPERLVRVMEFIEKNYSEHITQTMLAREACLSAGHFGVLFKATTGMTPEQYVLRTRLLHAKTLIESGNYSVSEVAYMTGFSDHSHFTSQFKRFFAAPPRTFLPSLRRV